MQRKVEKLADALDASDFRWPKKGDRLFKRSQRWDGGVGFSDHPYARDAHIWDGYMTAASVLVERCRNTKQAATRHKPAVAKKEEAGWRHLIFGCIAHPGGRSRVRTRSQERPSARQEISDTQGSKTPHVFDAEYSASGEVPADDTNVAALWS